MASGSNLVQHSLHSPNLPDTGYYIYGTSPELSHEAKKAIGTGVLSVLTQSLHLKFDTQFGHEAVEEHIPTAVTQLDGLLVPNRDIRYWVARSAIEAPELPDEGSVAMVRVETYAPPRNRSTDPHRPMIADLETIDGKLATGHYRTVAAGILWLALGYYTQSSLISARVEAPNHDGLDFYGSIGFEIDPINEVRVENWGVQAMKHVGLVAESVQSVRERLMQNYDFSVV